MGTRFLLTSDSPVPDVVKQAYLASDVTGTVVTTRVDGVPHRVLRTAAGGAPGPGRAGHRAAAVSPQRGRVPQPVRAQLAGPDPPGPRDAPGTELTWAQVLMAANTPMLLRAAMVDGRPDLGLMSAGQVAGLIGDLPSCAELIGAIMTEAGAAPGARARHPVTLTDAR